MVDKEKRIQRRKVKRGGDKLKVRNTHTPGRLQVSQATLDGLGRQSHVVRLWFPQRCRRNLYRERNSMSNPITTSG